MKITVMLGGPSAEREVSLRSGAAVGDVVAVSGQLGAAAEGLRLLFEHGAEVTMAATLEDGAMQVQPVFCLMRSDVLESLVRFTQSGQRKIDKWTATLHCVEVAFDDAQAFVNVNTPDELKALKQHE